MIRIGLERGLKRLNFRTTLRVVAVVGTLFFWHSIGAQPLLAADARINCDAHKGACRQTIGDVTVSLEIEPRPVQAMQDLKFQVTLSGSASARPAYIDLGMPGMKMGPNRVMLKPTASGQHEGRGVIVKCASGRRTWFAVVTVPGLGEAKFVFDVIY